MKAAIPHRLKSPVPPTRSGQAAFSRINYAQISYDRQREWHYRWLGQRIGIDLIPK